MEFNLKQTVSARGYYSVHVLDAEGNDTGKSVGDVSNVVTAHGHTLPRSDADTPTEDSVMASGSLNFAAGTGTVERTVTSTGLGSELAVSRGTVNDGAGTGFTDNGDGTETYKRVCKGSYPLGSINETVSEIGIFKGDLVAGQLIKDGSGNPTTVTVLSDEQLVVTYTIEWTYSKDVPAVMTGTVDVNGTSTDWTLNVTPVKANGNWKYLYGLTSFQWAFEQQLIAPDGTMLAAKDMSTNSIEELSGVTKITLGGSWSPSEGSTDVASVRLAAYGNPLDVLEKYSIARIDFSPAIPKTDADVLDVVVSWELSGT